MLAFLYQIADCSLRYVSDWELRSLTGRAMNPINAEGNMFSNLFDKVPAKRAGVPEDIVATILYLVSKAGVLSFGQPLLITTRRT